MPSGNPTVNSLKRDAIANLPFSIIRFAEIDSTNRLLRDAGRESPEDGLVAVADCQTAGRGRLGKKWESPRGEGLYFSLTIAPLDSTGATIVPLAAAVVLFDTLIGSFPALKNSLDIKWPNDMLLKGKKGAGIMAELENSIRGVPFVVLGIGINCNQTSFSAHLPAATSLALELGAAVDRDSLLEVFLARWHSYTPAGIGHLPLEQVVSDWKARSSFWRGQWVRFSESGIISQGLTCDIAPSGALVLQLPSGGRKRIFSGEVEWIRSG